MTIPSHVLAQTAAADPLAAPQNDQTVHLDKVTVTGSNIQMTLADADKSALPVDIVSDQRFQLTSGENVSDFMRTVPSIMGTSTTMGNIENTNQGVTLNLRGLGPNYTLVLVDGRRFAGEGSNADVGSIPAEAIDSIEILKGGSSAIYGTDAVAGVINIKLKKNYQGAEVLASYGNTTNKDAGGQRYALSFGQEHDKLSISGTAEWQRHNAIFRTDRSVTYDRNWVSIGGTDQRNGTYTTVQRILGLPAAPAGLIIDVTKIQPGQTSLNPNSYVAVQPDQKLTTSEPEAWPAYRAFGTNWNVEYKIFGKQLVLFDDGLYHNEMVHFQFQPPTARVNVPANNPYNPFGLPVTVVYSFGPNEKDNSRPPADINNISSLSNTFGARGDIGRISYELSYERFHRQDRQTEQNDIDQTKAQAALDAGTFNPFGYWANSPTLIDSLYMNPRDLTIDENLDVLTAKVSGTIVELPTGNLDFALGAENRKATWGIDYDEGWRTIVTLWHPPSAADVNSSRGRSIDAYFGELRVPLWTSHTPDSVLTSAEVSGAERRETYAAGKAVNVPQGSGRLAFWDDSLVLRGSYSESFRAPSLANLGTPVTTTLNSVSTVFDPVRGGALPFNVTQGGNPNLMPESGKNYDLGVVYSPKFLPNLTLKTDYWNIKIANTIVTPSIVDVMNGNSPVGFVTRDANQFPTVNIVVSNAGEITEQGYDIGATYRLNNQVLGDFTFDLNGTFTTDFKSHFGTTVTQYVDKVSATYGEIPKFRSVLGTYWDKGNWEAAFFVHYMSGATEPVLTYTRHVVCYVTGDFQVSYKIKESPLLWGALKNTKLTFGIDNFWDEPIPFVNSLSEGWDRTMADYRGRYIYVEVRKKF